MLYQFTSLIKNYYDTLKDEIDRVRFCNAAGVKFQLEKINTNLIRDKLDINFNLNPNEEISKELKLGTDTNK